MREASHCAILREYLKKYIDKLVIAWYTFKVRLIPYKSGDYGMKVTPVPIPNTKVKLQCADGTAGVTLWKSRLSPGNKENTKFILVFFLR